ncbi:MAG: bifunctional adenosylcobinamide kinase/adenosylcobinamide-phosphate guanylyltransferase [Thermodesulfobacteriota bacterium]
MGHIILVTGGSRSGKSDYAQARAESIPGPRAFVATCPVVDAEMAERIRRHQEKRHATQWETVEEPVHVASVIREAGRFRVLLVDCLTLWINNLMFEAQQEGKELSEEDAVVICRDLREACALFTGTVFFVTNEVGMGIVPSDPITRKYRDLVGRCNQIIAQAADKVILVVCGIPMVVKGARDRSD